MGAPISSPMGTSEPDATAKPNAPEAHPTTPEAHPSSPEEVRVLIPQAAENTGPKHEEMVEDATDPKAESAAPIALTVGVAMAIVSVSSPSGHAVRTTVKARWHRQERGGSARSLESQGLHYRES